MLNKVRQRGQLSITTTVRPFTFRLAQGLSVLLIALLASASKADAQPTDERAKTETDGPSISAGFGSRYGVLGTQVSYYFQIPGTLYRVVPYAGIGMIWAEQFDIVEIGFAGGLMGSWGHKHRFVLDLTFSPTGVQVLRIYGLRLDSHIVYGIGLAIGYEYMTFSGFNFRVGIGAAYSFQPPIYSIESGFGPALNIIDLGYKFK